MTDDILIEKDEGWHAPDAWTSVPNKIARHRALSLEARGLILYIASHSAKWQIRMADLIRETGSGRDRLRRILRELHDAGFLEKGQARDAGGRLGVPTYKLRSTPRPVTENPATGERNRRSAPATGKPSPGEPSPEQPSTANTTPYKKNINAVEQETEDHPPGGDDAARRAAEEGALPLDLPEPEPQALTAAGVIAAYVEAYRASHDGGDPLSSHRTKIGNHAKRILREDAVTPDVILAAARSLGAGDFTDLGTEINRVRSRSPQNRPAIGRRSRSGVLGPAPVPPRSERPTPELLPPPEQWTESERETYAWQAAEDGIPEDVWVMLSNRLRLAATPEEEQAVRDEWDRTEAEYRDGKVATG